MVEKKSSDRAMTIGSMLDVLDRRSEAPQIVFEILRHVFISVRNAVLPGSVANLGDIPSTEDEQIDHLIGLTYELGVQAALGENDHPYAALASRIEEFRRRRSAASKPHSYPRRQRTPREHRRPKPARTSLPDDT